jgi:hypothetical protein
MKSPESTTGLYPTLQGSCSVSHLFLPILPITHACSEDRRHNVALPLFTQCMLPSSVLKLRWQCRGDTIFWKQWGDRRIYPIVSFLLLAQEQNPWQEPFSTTDTQTGITCISFAALNSWHCTIHLCRKIPFSYFKLRFPISDNFGKYNTYLMQNTKRNSLQDKSTMKAILNVLSAESESNCFESNSFAPVFAPKL